MGNITDQISRVFRDFVTDGVAASGIYDPPKSDIRAIGPLIESAIATAGLGSLVAVTYSTRAALNGDLAHAANTVALVYGDATDANNDLYVKVGASGAGSWTVSGAFHSAVAGLIGSGVLNAIKTWKLVTAAIEAGFYYHRSTGAKTSNAIYQNIVYNLDGSELGLRASGTLGGGSTVALAVYFAGANAGGAVLGYEVGADNAAHSKQALTIPVGTASVAISSLISGIPIRLEKGVNIDGGGLTEQSYASLRAQSRTALENMGTIPADYGNAANVHGYAVSGDHAAVRYKRGSGIFPTSNGWGIDPGEISAPALAFGISTPRDDVLTSSSALAIYAATSASQAKEDTNDVIVTMPASGLYTPKGIDWNKLFYADLTNGQTLEVDLSHLPLAKQYRFSSRYEVHTGRIVFDAGYGNTFVDTGTRFLSCTPGTKISILRSSLTVFQVVSVGQVGANAAPSGIAQGSYAPAVRAASCFVAGQSLMAQGYGYGSSHGAFVNRLAAIAGPASMHVVNAAYGGSGVCERDADPSTPTNYWVDMTNPLSPADGPNLTAAIAAITAKNGDTSQPGYDFGLVDHGQQSSAYVDSPLAPNANFTKAMYKTATQHMISRLRAAAGSSTLPIGLRVIGRRSSWSSANAGRMQVIREAQLEMVAADANLFLAGETFDVELRDTVHPTDTGYDIIGTRDADETGKVVYAKTGLLDHPYIYSATFNATFNYIDVVMRTGLFTSPAVDRVFLTPDPKGFYVIDAGGNTVPVFKAIWTRSTTSDPTYHEVNLRLFLDGSAAGGMLYYPYDNFEAFDAQRVIRSRSQSGGKALRSAKVAL